MTPNLPHQLEILAFTYIKSFSYPSPPNILATRTLVFIYTPFGQIALISQCDEGKLDFKTPGPNSINRDHECSRF